MKGHINNSYNTNVTHYSETLSIQGFQRLLLSGNKEIR